jgi:hypothetical protein
MIVDSRVATFVATVVLPDHGAISGRAVTDEEKSRRRTAMSSAARPRRSKFWIRVLPALP